MTKSKHAKPQEFEKEQIRHLKKLLKQANQTIGQLRKELGYNQNKTEKTKKKETELLPNCECGKGFLKEIEVANRIIFSCNLCDFRKVVKL